MSSEEGTDVSTVDRQIQPRQTSAFPPSELIGLLYEAAAEPFRWPFWFDALAASVGNRASNLVINGFGPTRYVCLDAPESKFDTINPSRVFENKALSKRSFAIAYVSGEIVEDWSQLQPEGAVHTGVQVFADETRSLDADDRALPRTDQGHGARRHQGNGVLHESRASSQKAGRQAHRHFGL